MGEWMGDLGGPGAGLAPWLLTALSWCRLQAAWGWLVDGAAKGEEVRSPLGFCISVGFAGRLRAACDHLRAARGWLGKAAC